MKSTIRSNGGKPMAGDSEAKKKWDKENVLFVTTKMFKTTDADILQFLEGKTRAEQIKKALRLLMAQEGFVYTPPSENTDEGE